MNVNEIKTLLEKFYQGATTLDEEKLLQKYFANSNEDNENFAAEKYLFSNLNLAAGIEMPSDLTEKIVAKIDNENQKNRFQKFTLNMRLRTISVAACFALLVSATEVILFNSESPKLIANVSTSETEIIKMLENSFSKISGVVDDAVALLDITSEQVCELDEAIEKN